MIIGVLKENETETRVSALPEHIPSLLKLATGVYVESGAGKNAYASDEAYREAGAEIALRNEVIEKADLLLIMHLPHKEEWPLFRSKIIIGNYQPFYFRSEINELAGEHVTVFSIDMIPRTTRAQSMDILSSQANIAGYKSVVLAASLYPRYFPMFMTAAGSITPAKVLILGAGVAGLQAIATARRLGAVVEVFDTRPAVKEEVMSLGARFVEVEGAADASKAGGYAVQQTEEYLLRQKERIAASVAKSDIIITTAQIFGKKAPVLITEEMIRSMKKGSVIIDLAASTGGNTELTKNNETIEFNGVTIVGRSDLPATVPSDASKLYGKNCLNFLALFFDAERNFTIPFDDELIQGTCIVYDGEVRLAQ